MAHLCASVGLSGGEEPGSEVADAVRDVLIRVLERIGGAQPDRVGYGPVDSPQAGKFLVGVVAHGDNEVPLPHNLVEAAGGGVGQLQAVPAGDVDGTAGDLFGRVRSGGGGGDPTDLLPERGG